MAFLCAYFQIPDLQIMAKWSWCSQRDQRRSQVTPLFLKKVATGRVSWKSRLLHFPLRVVPCSVPPPLPPGETGCGMLRRGNVVWSVCWQRGKEAQHVLAQSPTGVKLKLCGSVYVQQCVVCICLSETSKHNFCSIIKILWLLYFQSLLYLNNVL